MHKSRREVGAQPLVSNTALEAPVIQLSHVAKGVMHGHLHAISRLVTAMQSDVYCTLIVHLYLESPRPFALLVGAAGKVRPPCSLQGLETRSGPSIFSCLKTGCLLGLGLFHHAHRRCSCFESGSDTRTVVERGRRCLSSYIMQGLVAGREAGRLQWHSFHDEMEYRSCVQSSRYPSAESISVISLLQAEIAKRRQGGLRWSRHQTSEGNSAGHQLAPTTTSQQPRTNTTVFIVMVLVLLLVPHYWWPDFSTSRYIRDQKYSYDCYKGETSGMLVRMSRTSSVQLRDRVVVFKVVCGACHSCSILELPAPLVGSLEENVAVSLA